MEALEDESLEIHKLHLSDSNKPAKVIDQMQSIAKRRSIEILYHDKSSLSRISKSAKQDQGVALDIVMPYSSSADEFISERESYRIIVLDGVTNPQNLGMIIRSCAAGSIDAVMIPAKGNAQISPLVIKASVGTLFKIPVIKADKLVKTLNSFSKNGAVIYTLSSDAKVGYRDMPYSSKSVFVLGNESSGVSPEVRAISDREISIPMQRGVESLNVAVTAALLAFM